jgi:hypothetical protein
MKWMRLCLIFSLGFSGIAFAQDEELICFNVQCFKPEPPSTSIRNIPDTTEVLTPNPTITENLVQETPPARVQDTLTNDSKYFEIIDQWDNSYNKRFMNVAAKDLQSENDPMWQVARPVIPIVFFNRPDCRRELFPEDEDLE